MNIVTWNCRLYVCGYTWTRVCRPWCCVIEHVYVHSSRGFIGPRYFIPGATHIELSDFLSSHMSRSLFICGHLDIVVLWGALVYLFPFSSIFLCAVVISWHSRDEKAMGMWSVFVVTFALFHCFGTCKWTAWDLVVDIINVGKHGSCRKWQGCFSSIVVLLKVCHEKERCALGSAVEGKFVAVIAYLETKS